ncbi:MAG TPA: hypothetical protein PLR60_04095 [Syntrophorhabdaceae bacterium]|nr:hypothetical protein [Syntrophorhabdaceae bacterium]
MKKRAISLISGGLDSAVGTKLIIDQGIEVIGLHFTSIFASKRDKERGLQAHRTARELGIEMITKKKGDDYIEIIKNPRYGYGKNMNPCIDCRIYMLRLTKDLLGELDASFVVTGEVLGQRPMSQRRNTMELIEKQSGLKGLIVRPLSAKHFPPTIPEQEGIIDREKLLDIAGRGRHVQYQLVDTYKLTEFGLPGGGCLLTDPIFSRKFKDLIATDTAYTTKDIELLTMGRHLRLSPSAKLIVGRNERENGRLTALWETPYVLMYPVGFTGPHVILKGDATKDNIMTSAQVIAHYGKGMAGTATVEINDGAKRTFSFSPEEIDSDAMLI